MAHPSSTTLDLARAVHSPPGRAGAVAKTLANRLWLPLLFFFGFLLCYLLPFHGPAPHGVKVAVAGQVSAADISAGLQQQSSGAFEVIPVQSAEQAQQQVFDQAAQAAFVVNGANATLYIAGANGSSLNQVVIKAFTPVADAQQLSLRTVNLVPTVPGDPSGTSVYFVALSVCFVPVLLNLQLVQATELSRRAKLAIFAGMGVFASIAAFLIAYGLGAVPGQSLAMLYGFLAFEAVSLTIFGLAPFTGRYLPGVAALLFVFLSIPSSGGSVSYLMVPTFFAWLHPIMPMGNLIDALRSICYFDGTNMTRPTLVLLAWIAVGAALITAAALLERARHREATAVPAASPAPADPAAAGGRAVRELPGPAVGTADPSVTQPAAGHAMPAGNGAGSPGRRPPVLFGRVTDPAGVPVAQASITIIDARGHQLLRTTTDHNGCYAADALLVDRLTLLVSTPDRMPVATRVTPATDLPVRHDVVLPDPARSTAVPT